jgi:hypothetical protein
LALLTFRSNFLPGRANRNEINRESKYRRRDGSGYT